MLTAAPVASTPLRIVRRSKVFLAIGSTVRLGLRCDGRKRVVRDDGEHEIGSLKPDASNAEASVLSTLPSTSRSWWPTA